MAAIVLCFAIGAYRRERFGFDAAIAMFVEEKVPG
jgi:hypothetical protein